MKFIKRAFPFILLNIIVSAVTTLAILIWWNSTHPLNLPAAALATPTPPVGLAQEPTPSLPPLDAPLIEINSVIGAGDLANEVVVLRLIADQEVLLYNWVIVGSGGSQYTLPNLLLKSGEIQLFSGSKPVDRPESAGNLYWNRTQPAWRSGETLTLLDSLGGIRATFKIP